jgi:hypothetical protein
MHLPFDGHKAVIIGTQKRYLGVERRSDDVSMVGFHI